MTEPIEIQVLREEATAGDPDAMYRLGTSLWELAPSEARQWLERAADHGLSRAMYALGYYLSEEEPAKAVDWWSQAAELENHDAINALANHLWAKDPASARQLLERAAGAGDVQAMFNLGYYLETTSPAEALEWLQQAADRGYSRAMVRLGTALLPTDPARTLSLWEEAAELGDSAAMAKLGWHYRDTDQAQSRQWYEKAAALENTWAMTALAWDLDPFHVPFLANRSDRRRATSLLGRAAELGDSEALFRLGYRELQWDPCGVWMPTRHRKARPLLEQAGHEGNLGALRILPIMVGRQDPRGAAEWLTRAAEAGVAPAIAGLGTMEGNPRKALQLYSRASEFGLSKGFRRGLRVIVTITKWGALWTRVKRTLSRHSSTSERQPEVADKEFRPPLLFALAAPVIRAIEILIRYTLLKIARRPNT